MKRLEEIYNECECNKKSEILEAMKKYAEECVKASLEKASEKAEYGIWQNDDMYLSESNIFINRQSITNPDNMVLL